MNAGRGKEMKSSIQSRVYLAPAVATGFAMLLFMGLGMIVSGDEQQGAAQPSPDPLGARKNTAGHSQLASELQAEAEKPTTATVVRKLTDKQLAVIGAVDRSLTA